jgi:Leucine-rich repeat (LRR) protein
LLILDGKSYAYSTLNLEEKEIQELGEILRPYQHLTNLNLSKNDIRDISEVRHFSHLINLNASTNQVASIMFL